MSCAFRQYHVKARSYKAKTKRPLQNQLEALPIHQQDDVHSLWLGWGLTTNRALIQSIGEKASVWSSHFQKTGISRGYRIQWKRPQSPRRMHGQMEKTWGHLRDPLGFLKGNKNIPSIENYELFIRYKEINMVE